MAKKKQHRRRRRPNNSKDSKSSQIKTNSFVSSAGIGCYIAFYDDQSNNEWIVEWQHDLDIEQEFGCDAQNIPDIALDPEESSVCFCNTADMIKVAYITVFETTCIGRNGRALQHGSTTDEEGTTQKCITFIIKCPPRTFCHLCTLKLEENQSITDVKIDSDVQEYTPHPNPTSLEHGLLLSFPLQGGPFLCTQSEGGCLTHFFAGNLHALDFRCDIGTPIVAAASGIVLEVKTSYQHTTGIAVSNLFKWNSILIEVTEDGTETSPLFIEYVHIATACVSQGDSVERGQVIGTSGSIGFSPEPHLHFSAFASREDTAPTIRVKFASENGDTFLPIAGRWYSSDGQVEAPANYP